MERSEQELEYWHSRAEQMRSVLDRLETDYLTHRTDCFVVRRRQLRQAVSRALEVVAALETGEGWVPDMGVASTTSSGCSTPTENTSLLSTSQPPSNVADFSRNVKRLVNRSHLKCTSTYSKDGDDYSALIIQKHESDKVGLLLESSSTFDGNLAIEHIF